MDLDNLKDHIKDIELDFDQNEVWSSIERAQKKEKKKIFFWWSSLFAGLFVVVGLFYVLDSSMSADTKIKNVEVTQNLSGEIQMSVSTKNELKNDLNFSRDIVHENIEREENSDKSNYEGESNSVTTNNISISSDKKIIVDLSLGDASPNIKSNEASNEVRNTFANNVDKGVSEVEVSEALSNYNYRDNLQTTPIESTLKNLIAVKEVVQDERKELSLITALPMVDFLELIYSENIYPPSGEALEYSIGADDVESKFERKIYLTAIAQYGLLQRSLTSNEDNSLGLSLREESEAVLDHSVVGLQINIPIAQNYFIATGIEHNRFTTKLEYSSSFVRPLNPDDLPVGLQNAYGFAIQNSNSKYYNHVDLVNVPLLIGVKWNQSRWTETLSVGTAINLYSSSRQLYLDEWNSLSDNSGNVKSKFNNSYLFRAGLGYNLWSQFEWSVYASYRYTPNIMDNESQYSESYYSYLVGTGIGYNF